MHQDSRAVIQVVRYGLNILCLPNEHAVELVERQIAKRKHLNERTTDDFEPEITFTDENGFSID